MNTAKQSSVHFMSEAHDWETPQPFFDALNAEFRFTVDACASPENAKCDRFWTYRENGLAQNWAGMRVWCNPPYGREIAKWIEKAANSEAEIAVLLIPARTDTKAWHRHIFGKAEIRFVEGRLKFSGGARIRTETAHLFPARSLSGVKDAPFASAVVIYRFSTA